MMIEVLCLLFCKLGGLFSDSFFQLALVNLMFPPLYSTSLPDMPIQETF